jgi:hypothetical protein
VISTQPGLHRYLHTTPPGLLRLDAAAVATQARLDGQYLLRTADPHLSAEDIALGYKQLLEVEHGWRQDSRDVGSRRLSPGSGGRLPGGASTASRFSDLMRFRRQRYVRARAAPPSRRVGSSGPQPREGPRRAHRPVGGSSSAIARASSRLTYRPAAFTVRRG